MTDEVSEFLKTKENASAYITLLILEDMRKEVPGPSDDVAHIGGTPVSIKEAKAAYEATIRVESDELNEAQYNLFCKLKPGLMRKLKHKYNTDKINNLFGDMRSAAVREVGAFIKELTKSPQGRRELAVEFWKMGR